VPGRPGQRFRPPGNPSHDGVDIPEPRNTPIHAASAGKVITAVCNTSGSSCDVDGSLSVRGCGWYAEIQHPGQIITRYCHMVRRPSVRVGQQVSTGQLIGYVGTSGNSSGPHLHFEVHVGAGRASRANAVDPVAFMQRMNAPLGGPTANR
jgi:murein DD-endopeptidase MepM/ murein hydrolase activator NlpD